MASLRCTFNCRGWNSGISTLKYYVDSLDLCFVQEHWSQTTKITSIKLLIFFQLVLVEWIVHIIV